MRTAPPTDSETNYLLCVNGAWLPLLLGKLAELEQGREWETADDHQRGYQWIAEVQASVACIDEITERLDRLIVLLGGNQALADPAAAPALNVNDNILLALRGTVEASTARNIIDLLAQAGVDDDEILAKLIEIAAYLA